MFSLGSIEALDVGPRKMCTLLYIQPDAVQAGRVALAMNKPITFFETVTGALAHAGQYNKNDQASPAAILWPDKERQWAPLLPVVVE